MADFFVTIFLELSQRIVSLQHQFTIKKIANMKSYQKRSQVLTIANALVKKGWSFSAAQKRGWEIVRFQEAIKKGEAIVRYYKENADIPEQRFAVAINPSNYTPKGSKARQNPLQVCYFETTSNSIKSFNVGRFDSFVAVAA